MSRKNLETLLVMLVLTIATFVAFYWISYLPVDAYLALGLQALWVAGCISFLVLTSLNRRKKPH